MADRWVVSDFAFPRVFLALARSMQCIGVSKNQRSGCRRLVVVRDTGGPGEPNHTLGDYPKFGLWPDAYYLSMNEFSNNTTFNGVRVYALDRNSMVNGGSANAIGFSHSACRPGRSIQPGARQLSAPAIRRRQVNRSGSWM